MSDADEGYPHGQCQLVDETGSRCAQPVPGPAIDEDGRRRGGRKGKYCSKAHADKASRLTRATAAEVTGEGLRRAVEMAEKLVPALREQESTVAGLRTLMEAIEAGALGRVETAEAETDRARRETALAEMRATEAERLSAAAEQRAAAALEIAESARQAQIQAELARQEAAAREKDANDRVKVADARAEAATANEREAHKTISALNGDLVAAREQLRDYEAFADAVEQEVARLHAEIDKQRHAADQLSDDNARLATDLAAARSELARQVAESRSQLNAARTDAESAAARADAATVDAAAARVDLAAATATNRHVTERLDAELARVRTEAAQQRERAAAAELRVDQMMAESVSE